MTRGPRGEKRPADVIGAAVKVMRTATGEEEEELGRAKSAAELRHGVAGAADNWARGAGRHGPPA